MELHKVLPMYVGHEEGGCTDIGQIELRGFALVNVKELQAALSEAFEKGFEEGYQASTDGADINHTAFARESGLEYAAAKLSRKKSKYKWGIDYPFNGVVPDLPPNTEVELVYFCGTRQKMKMTKGNMACWHPRPQFDPQIKAFCIVDENYTG